MRLLDRLRGNRTEERNDPLSFDQWMAMFSFLGTNYTVGLNTTLGGNEERIAPTYSGWITGALQGDAVVFACCAVRLRVFTEARFAFQRMRQGRPGDLWTDASLALLEHPWPGGTTGDLLGKALLSADFGGNAFIARVAPDRLQVLRPDWVTIVSEVVDEKDTNGWDLGAEVIGYIYHPGGRASGREPVALLPNRVAHFAPMPDPLAPWRGMSWLAPVIREVQGDLAATTHKLKFFEGGATPNLLVKADPQLNPDNFKAWVKLFKEMHPEGLQGAYQRIFLGGGADASVIGANLRQVDFKQTQGAGETRIAAAAGVPPVLVGLSEGLQAATYSNYGQARRAFADEWARPTWRNFAGSLQTIITTPSDSRLWYDDRDVPFLQEDQKDEAEILSVRASTVKSLVDAGFESTSVVAAVDANDLSLLKHTGLFSVQLQPPGGELAPSGNGKVPVDAVAPGQ
jgi:phage portal protein BeeE